MNKSVAEYADQIITMIHADQRQMMVPLDVGSFSALHDHVDANMYVLNAMGEADTYEAETETNEHNALVNSIMNEVDRRLRVGAGLTRLDAAIDGLERLQETVYVVVTFPDAEAREAARISGLQVYRTKDEVLRALTDTEEIYEAEVGGEGANLVASADIGGWEDEETCTACGAVLPAGTTIEDHMDYCTNRGTS